jgi:glycosyltransferase involved in cell wall biosynthesis
MVLIIEVVGSVGVLSMWVGYRFLYSKREKVFKATGEGIRNASPLPDDISITVVVPAYNEEHNIVACARAILESSELDASRFQLIVVDDMSKDGTVAAIEEYYKSLAPPEQARLKIVSAGPRPTNEVWLGKTWAVWQASQHATGTYIVFVDADVRIKKNGLDKAVSCACKEKAMLLSGDVAFKCGCFSEWLVQPVILQNLVLNNDHRICNDPTQDVAAAAGHVMIFNRELYVAIKGHTPVRDHVVEDVMIAYYVKVVAKQRALYYDFTDVAEIQMYQNFSEMQEGYSKNIYLAFDKSALMVLGLVTLNFIAFAGPVAAVVGGGVHLAMGATQGAQLGMSAAMVGSGLGCTAIQYSVRRDMEASGRIPSDYWYLEPVGGMVVCYLAKLSLFKGITGYGWTWKGRPLTMPGEETEANTSTDRAAAETKKDK